MKSKNLKGFHFFVQVGEHSIFRKLTKKKNVAIYVFEYEYYGRVEAHHSHDWKIIAQFICDHFYDGRDYRYYSNN